MLALESDLALPLVETVLERLRLERVIAPGITTIERVVWGMRRLADRVVECWLTQPLTNQHRDQLEALLQIDPEFHPRRRVARHSCLVGGITNSRAPIQAHAYCRASSRS
jgi:hypothetical protein